jgi:hypothetical protein
MAAFLLASLLIATGRGTPPLTTTFNCIRSGENFATIARRGTRTTPPMILWETKLGLWDAWERCRVVSQRLTAAVAEGGGTFQNLLLTYGRVNNQPVICYVRSMDSACNSQNLLFTKKTGSKAPPFTAAFANLETEARVINLSKNPIAYRLRNNPRLSLASSTVRLGKTEPPCKGKRLGR